MKLYGLIGYPLSHSFSKKYFTDKFNDAGIKNCTYENFPLQSIEELLPLLNHKKISGLNVTIPYKEKVIPFLDRMTKEVEETGACNCIKIDETGLTGYNTDITGFELSLKKLLKPYHRKALVLGSGGASKAVCYVLKRLGIDYRIVSRSHINESSISYHQLDKDILSTHLLIINTTPVGMYPHTEECPEINFDFLGSNHFLFDLIYNPGTTTFLKRGAERGATVQNGLEMLEIQAEESWKIWNNLS